MRSCGRRPWIIERLQGDGGERAKSGYRGDNPDQVPHRNYID